MKEYENIVKEVKKYSCLHNKTSQDYKHEDVKKEYRQQQEKSQKSKGKLLN